MYIEGMITPRRAVTTMASYRAGRSGGDAAGSPAPEALARLASNESPFPPLPSVVEAITRRATDVNRYPEPTSATLRARLAAHLGVDADWVTTGAGSVALLWQVAQTFVDAGREIVTPWVSFEAYPIIAQLMGATHVGAPLRGHRPDVDSLLARITDRTDAVIVAQPNNPTGGSLTGDELDALVAATAHRCMLVVDEAYLEFGDDPHGERSLDLVRRQPHVVALRTFSKAHGLAGLRVGYAVAAPAIVELLDRVAPPFAVSAIAADAAIASLDARSEMTERVTAVVDERERVLDALRRMGVAVPPTATNFVWLPTAGSEAAVAEALERGGVLARPLAGHGVRVTIGTPEENDRLIAAVAGARSLLVPTGQPTTDQRTGTMAVA